MTDDSFDEMPDELGIVGIYREHRYRSQYGPLWPSLGGVRKDTRLKQEDTRLKQEDTRLKQEDTRLKQEAPADAKDSEDKDVLM